MTEHSPKELIDLPWSAEPTGDGLTWAIFDSSGGEVAYVDAVYEGGGDVLLADASDRAAFIVRAVNSHAQLVEALEWYASDEAWTCQQVEGPDGDYGRRAKAALAALEEKP